jgi:hypothetical protein
MLLKRGDHHPMTVSYRGFRILLPTIVGMLGALLLFSFLGEARSMPASAAHTWLLLPIDTISDRWDQNRISMEIDAQGRTHLAYRSHDQLHYARVSGSSIDTQVLSAAPYDSDYSLALDPQGQPHLAVVQNHVLLYATRSGDTWLFETISAPGETCGGYPYAVSLAIDVSGTPHISYRAASAVLYATYGVTGWITQTVDAGMQGSSSSALAVTPDGVPRIAYESWDLVAMTDTLKYAVWNGGGWDIQTIEQNSLLDVGPSTLVRLRLDRDAQPHVLYFKDSDSGPSWKIPIYASLEGSSWVTEVVPGTFAAAWGDLALDTTDRPHVVYAGSYGLDGVFYGVRGDGGWEVEEVTEPSFFGGAGAGMAISPVQGTIRLGFEDCYYNKVYVAYYLDHQLFLPSVQRY